ncbi:MAG: phasin family protein [Pseudomonadota bacterium]
MATYTDSLQKAATQVNDTARDIYLAGLGALAVTQNEGGKLFDSLVKEGQTFETKTRKDVDGAVTEFRGTIEERITKVRTDATTNVKKLEKLFDERVARVLARLGIPTSDDIQKLAKRVQDLSKEVKALNGQSAKKAA